MQCLCICMCIDCRAARACLLSACLPACSAAAFPCRILPHPADVAAAIQRLSQETGVELRMSAAGAGTGGSSSATDPGRQLLDALLQIKHAVGLA